VGALLAAYVGGAVDAPTGRRIEEHLAHCPDCSREALTWRQVGGVLRDESHVDAPPAYVLAAVLEQIALEKGRAAPGIAPAVVAGIAPPSAMRSLPSLLHGHVTPRRRRPYVWQVVREQARLVHTSIWLASALVMALGWLVAVSTEAASSGLVLQLVAPIVAACGVSLIYGPETDPFLEVIQATPASPRLLLLARLTVVFGYDCALTVVATLGLTALGDGGGVWTLTQEWLGPILLLSALALVLAQHLGPSAAMAIALLLWGARVISAANGHLGLLDGQLAHLLAAGWSTNALTLTGALVLLGAALVSVQHREGWGWKGWRSIRCLP
jgi:hypothetical protein